MRISLREFRAQADLAEQFSDARIGRFAVGNEPVDVHRLTDDLADRHAWIERCVGILEDNLDFASDCLQLGRRSGREIYAGESDLASGWLFEPQDQSADGGLAAAGFADQAQGLPGIDRKAHVFDRAHDRGLASEPGAHREMLGQAAHRQERLGALRRRLLPGGAARLPHNLSGGYLFMAVAAR